MRTPNAAQMEWARQLLAHESAGCDAEPPASVAGRVYDKLLEHLAPLIGSAGVQLLLVRSATLAQREFAGLADVGTIQNATDLRTGLQALEPDVATQAAEALFGTFLALITTFIGERLATQILRAAWPTVDEVPPTETRR